MYLVAREQWQNENNNYKSMLISSLSLPFSSLQRSKRSADAAGMTDLKDVGEGCNPLLKNQQRDGETKKEL